MFLSSHLMGEMALTADHLIVIGRGLVLRDVSVARFLADAGGARVLVGSPRAAQLRELLLGPQVTVSSTGPGAVEVRGLTSDEIGARAGAANLVLFELTSVRASLEDAYMEITATPWSTTAAGRPHRRPGARATEQERSMTTETYAPDPAVTRHPGRRPPAGGGVTPRTLHGECIQFSSLRST